LHPEDPNAAEKTGWRELFCLGDISTMRHLTHQSNDV
jgi:hypothetical protein